MSKKAHLYERKSRESNSLGTTRCKYDEQREELVSMAVGEVSVQQAEQQKRARLIREKVRHRAYSS